MLMGRCAKYFSQFKISYLQTFETERERKGERERQTHTDRQIDRQTEGDKLQECGAESE